MATLTKKRKIFIGVAWPYVNDLFHIGNLAGAYLPPDIFARFHKLCGNEVLMVSGSDAHGTPITIRAQQEGIAPQEIAARYHELNKTYLKRFRIDYDLYTSTATDNHREVVQGMFLKLLEHGFIKILTTKQPYSLSSRTFLQDRYIQGECPYCHSKDARGDQCEKCGRALEPLELINPRSKIDNSPLISKETQNYFLDLSLLQKDIYQWLEGKRDWRTWVKAEALGWIKEGLKPRAITRDLDYGVPLPIESIPASKRIEDIEQKVFYVWFEAVIGYLSAAIEYARAIGEPSYWKKFFYEKNAETYYFVGQDNLVFHTINWPAQLLGYDRAINLPANVFVNKFLLLEGKKMSKSKGWFIETPYIVEHYAPDALRFYLALHMPQTKELDFTWKNFIDTNNNILVGTVGNFIHRTLTFWVNNFNKAISFETFSCETPVTQKIRETFVKTREHLEKGEFKEALDAVVSLATFGNRYLDAQKFWKDPQDSKNVALHALVIIYNLRLLLAPFVPSSTEKLFSLLGIKGDETIKESADLWQYALPKTLSIGTPVRPLFEKIDTARIAQEQEALERRAR